LRILQTVATRYQWDDFVLDLDSYRLERAGTPVSLEPKAFNLLALMVGRPGHLFTKQEIFDALWPDTAVTDHALTRVVAQLRRVLGEEAREARYLETVPTRGYRWIKEVTEAPSLPAPVAPAAPESDDRAPAIAAALALGIVALGFLGWAQATRPTAAVVDAPRPTRAPKWPVQVTTHAGLDMHPALSPQGDAIAFVSDRSGAFEIYVRALAGGSGEVPLTGDGQHNMQPAWSPDGRVIAYHANRRGGIWVIPARGGTPKQISPIGARPAWSPDGSQLAFQTDELGDIAPNGYTAQAGSTIWVIDADGGNPRQITNSTMPAGGHASPAWSRDGRFIAFTVFDGSADNGLWMASLAAKTAWPIDRYSNLYDPVFAADGSSLYATSGHAVIARFPIAPETGKLRAPGELLPIAGVPGARGLSLSPDGKRLVFAGTSLESQIWWQPVTLAGASAGEPKPLTSDTSRRNSLAMISPDGTKVAYMSIRQGELPNVWVMNIDGSRPIQLTSDETADHKPHWFPDGKRVAYFTKRGPVAGLWSVDIETRREQLVFEFEAEGQPPLDGRPSEFDLSPSLTKIAFSMVSRRSGQRTLFMSGADAFKPVRLGPAEAAAGYPSWSPDEQQLAVEIKDGSSTHAGVIDLATGTLRQLTRERGHTWVRGWSPDGRKIAVAVLRDGQWSLGWIDAATGKAGALTAAYPPSVYLRYPEWSPKGDRVLFERGVTRGNIWTIEIDASPHAIDSDAGKPRNSP
jgi:Tol biopolymer transport system component/DNA-binding winged helix-turn-helix (wHTH) protein